MIHPNSIEGVTSIAVIGFICVAGFILIKYFHIDLFGVGIRWTGKTVKLIGRKINAGEKRYHRDLSIGKINEKRKRVKLYRFLNDLIIDLRLKKRGATPYEFLVFIIALAVLVSLVFCELLFRSIFMGILMIPIVFIAIMCGLYTRANMEHDARIEAVLESENIISNNIKDGVVVAVRNSMDMMPVKVRGEYRDFLDNVELKNLHIRTALLELNNNLGSIADDFIKKCIVFEMEEEHGVAGMFRDVVEINHVKSELRMEMKRKFEEISFQFVIGAGMIGAFLAGVLAIYPSVREWYFSSIPGRLLLAGDCLILLLEFVYITYLRAREL